MLMVNTDKGISATVFFDGPVQQAETSSVYLATLISVYSFDFDIIMWYLYKYFFQMLKETFH